jgi:hypothetical protein
MVIIFNTIKASSLIPDDEIKIKNDLNVILKRNV